MKFYAERLKQLRQIKGLSLKALAVKVSVNDSMLSKYERGTHIPKLKLILDLARIFDVSVAELADLENIKLIPKDRDIISKKYNQLTLEDRKLVNSIIDRLLLTDAT
ncbi:MAG TPA: helix-turn-helix transcriptional regulator [Victivallales bacterium]|nr:helix-turn-helix transcriptional regulator [Victivallales bacterium]